MARASKPPNDGGGARLAGVEDHRFGVSFEDVQTFLAVSRYGGFSEAARQLNLAQPTVSARVGRLEERLGTRLLERSTRRVVLTPTGERLREEASAAFRPFIALLQEFREDAERRRKQVTVATTMGIASVVMPTLLASFHERHRDIAVRIEDGLPEDAVSSVRAGRADLAVLGLYEPRDDVVFEELLRDGCVVAGRRGHPLLASGTISIGELLSQPLLVADGNPALHRLIEAEAARRGLAVSIAPEGRKLRNVVTSLAMAAAGLGFVLPPRSLIPPEYKAIVDLAVLSDWSITPRYGIVRAPERPLGAAAQQFAEHLRRAVPNGQVGWPGAPGQGSPIAAGD